MKTILLALAAAASLNAAAAAPPPQDAEAASAPRALTPSEVQGLLNGKGMGLAKAAELNGYPGPAHVIELSEPLRLTPRQLAEAQAIAERMAAAAKALGAELLQAETELELLFRSRQVSADALPLALQRIAGLQARLRHAHLLAHVEISAHLSPEQVARYGALRGPARPGEGHAHP